MGNALGGLHVLNRIVVMRLGHAGDRRIPASPVVYPHQFLNDDRHGVIPAARPHSPGKCLGTLKPGRGIHHLHRRFKLSESFVELLVVVGQEISGIETGIGSELTVLEQTRGTHRERKVTVVQKSFEILPEPGWQPGINEQVGNVLITHC